MSQPLLCIGLGPFVVMLQSKSKSRGSDASLNPFLTLLLSTRTVVLMLVAVFAELLFCA